MKLSERAAYLKGLADGLGLKNETSEEKILRGAVDLLSAISEKVENLDGEVGNICGELDAIEQDIYGEEDAESNDEDEEDSSREDQQEAAAEYQLTCPKCGAVTVVDEDTLMSQEIVCSQCGAPFDIEFGENDSADEIEDK